MTAALTRIADALERLAPPPVPVARFDEATALSGRPTLTAWCRWRMWPGCRWTS